MSTSSLDTWADFAALNDPAGRNMLPNSALTHTAFTHPWPVPDVGSLKANDCEHHSNVFGLSPSIVECEPTYDFAHFQKEFEAWPYSSDNARSNSDTSSSAFSSDTSPSTADVRTPNDSASFARNKASPASSGYPAAHCAPQVPMSPDHLQSYPTTVDAGLLGYHDNVAIDHANHLADLVKSSAIIGAGHPGPRSLASSLSRSVMSAAVYNHIDRSAVSNPVSGRLSIQQRRRVSQQNASNQYSQSALGQHQRQVSAPDVVSNSSQKTGDLHQQACRPSTGCVGQAMPLSTVPRTDSSHEEWSDSLLANSHDLVFVLSLKGTVLFISASVERILGFTPEEIVGRPLVDFSHPADVGPCSRELKEAITFLPEDTDVHTSSAPKSNRRVDLIMRMACKSGGFCLIETTGKVSVDPPKQRKVIVCSGRPHPIPMLPWDDVRGDLMTSELSAWLKISHNGIFLGSTGPINRILGIEDVNLLGRHIRDLPMVTSSTDLLEALRCGRSISVQDHYNGALNKTPVKLTVYPWTSKGRSNALAFVHVQQQTAVNTPVLSQDVLQPVSPSKRKADADVTASTEATHGGAGSLSGSSVHSNGSSVPAMSANDAAATVFSELTGFHSGSWLIEMQKLHNTNRRLRHELNALRKQSPHTASKAVY